MKRLTPGLLITACLFFAACEGHLPNSLHQEIAAENSRLRDADRQLQRIQGTVENDLAKNPDWFRDVSEPGEWTAALRTARENLDRA